MVKKEGEPKGPGDGSEAKDCTAEDAAVVGVGT